jgi:protoporphyrinogen/coproporphyrinogen III oxidase
MPSGPPRHVVVVGGGIAGLAAAHRLRTLHPGLIVTVLEGSPLVGGKLRVGEVAGVPVDEGAEAILNRRDEAVGLARDVGLADQLTHPDRTDAAVWTRGALRPLPATLMGIPADLPGLRSSGVLSLAGLARARLEPLLPAMDIEDDVSVGDLVTSRLGGDVTARLVEPLLGGVYAGHADELSVHATVPALAAGRHRSILAAAREARLAGQRSSAPLFAGIRGGVGRLAPAVARASGAEIRTNAMVRELVRLAGDRWRAVVGPTRTPEVIDADAVILALPATAAGRLLRQVSPAAALQLGRIEYASVAIVTVAFEAASLPSPLPGSGFLVPPVDGRLIKATTFSSYKWGWLAEQTSGTVIWRCSVGRHREESDLQRSDSELVAGVLADLGAATGLRGTPVDQLVSRWGGALPQYAVGHRELVGRVHDLVGELPGLAVCGAAYDGLGIPACIASADRAATLVLRDLSARENDTHD